MKMFSKVITDFIPILHGYVLAWPGKSLITVSSRSVKAALQAVPGRLSKYEKLGGEIELEMAWQPLISTPGISYNFSKPR